MIHPTELKEPKPIYEIAEEIKTSGNSTFGGRIKKLRVTGSDSQRTLEMTIVDSSRQFEVDFFPRTSYPKFFEGDQILFATRPNDRTNALMMYKLNSDRTYVTATAFSR